MTSPPKRDADHTKHQLVVAARKHFAERGYEVTTVREIANDAGVNVALINRYFGSKEGLFEACMRGNGPAVTTTEPRNLEEFISRVVDHLFGSAEDENHHLLLMLIRSSGDTKASRIRQDKLDSFASRLLTFGEGGSNPSPAQMLRAQVAVSTILGMALLRSSTELKPLTSADAAELTAAVVESCTALLGTPRK